MKIQCLQKTNEDILRFYHKRFCCWHLSKFLLLTDIVFISKYVGKLKSNKCVAAKDLVVHECISAVSRFSSSFCPTVKPMVPDTPPTSQPLLRNTNENEKKYSWAFGRNTLVNSWGEGEWYICLYWDKAHFLHYGKYSSKLEIIRMAFLLYCFCVLSGFTLEYSIYWYLKEWMF